ncbi:Hypothetical protein NTJ_09192 [Nesidiocoris tenuis]|nr:Hypothetical protein NTJ_09192 [Nesidiocoris tenuis]
MNWLFGKKKPSLEVYVAEETPEGFTPVSTREYESPLPPYPTVPRLDNPAPYVAPYPPTPSPYPPSAMPYPPTPYPPTARSGPNPATKSGDSVNPLDSIPFVLAKSLAINRTRSDSDIESIKLLLNHVSARIDWLYSYDFELERSVIAEHNSKLGV